jgi:hypothetical protein
MFKREPCSVCEPVCIGYLRRNVVRTQQRGKGLEVWAKSWTTIERDGVVGSAKSVKTSQGGCT